MSVPPGFVCISRLRVTLRRYSGLAMRWLAYCLFLHRKMESRSAARNGAQTVVSGPVGSLGGVSAPEHGFLGFPKKSHFSRGNPPGVVVCGVSRANPRYSTAAPLQCRESAFHTAHTPRNKSAYSRLRRTRTGKRAPHRTQPGTTPTTGCPGCSAGAPTCLLKTAVSADDGAGHSATVRNNAPTHNGSTPAPQSGFTPHSTQARCSRNKSAYFGV